MDPEGLPDGRLGELLRAAAGPGRPHELAGEVDAVSMFRREYRPRNRHRRRLIALAVAGVAAVSVGGTAFAASTGHLPAPVREWLGESPTPAVTGHSPEAARSARPSPSARATTGAATTAGAATTPAFSATDACRTYLAFKADPRNRPVSGADRKELVRLAGSEPAIEAYCQRLLGVTATPTPASSKKQQQSSNGNSNASNTSSNSTKSINSNSSNSNSRR